MSFSVTDQLFVISPMNKKWLASQLIPKKALPASIKIKLKVCN